MSMQTISVKPLDGKGWMVECSGAENGQMFVNGAQAESSARRLAQRLADAGRPSRLTVYLRDGSVAGQFVTTH
jgi:hypothetical protein